MFCETRHLKWEGSGEERWSLRGWFGAAFGRGRKGSEMAHGPGNVLPESWEFLLCSGTHFCTGVKAPKPRRPHPARRCWS